MADTDFLFDQLALPTDVVGSNPVLRQWFVVLCGMSAAARVTAIRALVRDMVARRERAPVVVAFALLEDPRTYQAVRQTLVDRGYLRSDT
jgi:hypothetical protein